MKHVLLARLALVAAFLWSVAGPAQAGEDVRYMSAPELEAHLEAGDPVIVLDIQVESEYGEHHVRGAIPTHAYPVKSPEDEAKLDAVLPDLEVSAAPVVIVCPRGGGGARRAHAHLRKRGIPGERLYILEKGQAGWTCQAWTEGRE